MSPKPTIRCAIYTRKSSDEGLEQEFNSLDAQHEACAAYIASQRHEGWKQVVARYDDGGISGGTLERPALQRLLADIDAGRIGMVVVYKIDRLTRSLADFVRLVERLEAKGCSFVSVTQAFNTSSSMGRLTLNVLLSFAQFEREVTAERIRDKIAASKKKGLWMGGTLPLGYDRHPDPMRRELVVNPAEAEQVRDLFWLYGRLGCLRKVEAEALRLGLRSKLHRFATGRTRGGGVFSRGQLHYLLTNPVYLGQIRHKDRLWPGQHPAIVDQALWDRVQARLQAASARPRRRSGTDTAAAEAPGAPQAEGHLLTGKVRDETGDRLTPTHTLRHGRRLRYYVSNRLLTGSAADRSGWRLPAQELEAAVQRLLRNHFEASASRQAIVTDPEASTAAALAERIRHLTGPTGKAGPDRTILRKLVARIDLGRETISVRLDPEALAEALEVEPARLSPELIAFSAPLQLRRRGIETRIVAGEMEPASDLTLIRALAQAHRWCAAMRDGTSFAAIAESERTSDANVRLRSQLAFLSPKLQAMILDGRQPIGLTLERLMRNPVPLDWSAQERAFGIG